LNRYKCHKEVDAKQMSLGEYHLLREWVIPEDPKQEGYLVEYLDSPANLHKDFKNYISWSPKDVFENGYSEMDVSKAKMLTGGDGPTKGGED